MIPIFTASFTRRIAREGHSPSVERAILQLSEAMADRRRAYEFPLEFIRVPSDPTMLSESHAAVERLWTSRLKVVLLIGIGGSSLGAKAVFDAVGTWRDTRQEISLVTLDTCEPRLIEQTLRYLDKHVSMPEEIAIVIGTKSGTTSETLLNADIVISHLSRRPDNYHSRIVLVSDVGSPTREYAERHGYGFVPMPSPIGGRFSVFTPMGLVPLELLGVDVAGFRRGAADMAEHILSRKDTSATQLACEIASMRKVGIHIMDLFFFDPALESLGKWARQLIAESLGKTLDLDGRTVRAGITPSVSIGSTDLHSMAQLVFGGPRDKWTMFVTVRESVQCYEMGNGLSALAGIEGKTAAEVFRAIIAGVQRAYATHDLPLLSVELPTTTAYVIGAWMIWMMIAVAVAAEMLHVNAFDQPAVEDYKRATREYLAHQRR